MIISVPSPVRAGSAVNVDSGIGVRLNSAGNAIQSEVSDRNAVSSLITIVSLSDDDTVVGNTGDCERVQG